MLNHISSQSKNHNEVYGQVILLKFIYFEKATKCCKISTIDLSYVVMVESMVEIFQNFVAFSDNMNFNTHNFYDGTFYSFMEHSCK